MANPSTRISIQADDKATTPMRKVAQSAESLCAKIESLGNTATKAYAIVAGATGVAGIGSIIKNNMLAAGRYETLGIVMETSGKNAKYAETQTHGYEQALVRLGISMTEARGNIAKMAAANIDLDKATKLARVSQDLAVVGGINSSEAFEKVTHGIIAGQVEVLRTIGLNVQFEDSYKKMAAQLGKTSDSLTSEEKQLARVNLVLDEGARYAGSYERSMLSAFKKRGSLPRYFEDIAVLSGGLGQDTLGMGVDLVTEKAKTMRQSLQEATDSGEIAQSSRDIAEALKAVGTAIPYVATGLAALYLQRKISNSELAKSVVTTARLELAELQGTQVTLGSARALQLKAVAHEQEVLATLNATKAQVAQVQAEMQGSIALRVRATDLANVQKLEFIRAAGQKQLSMLQQQLIADESRYAASVNASAAATAKATISGRSLNSLRSAGSGLLAMLGGPWGLAFTGASLAAYGLYNTIATRNKDVEEARRYMEGLGKSVDDAGKNMQTLESRVSAIAIKDTLSRKLEEEKARVQKVLADMKGMVDQSGYNTPCSP